MDERSNRITALVLGILSVAGSIWLLLIQYGLAAEYGAAWHDMVVTAVVPVVLATLALVAAGSSTRSVLLVAMVVAMTVGGLPLAAWLGDAEHEDRKIAADASFTCNGPNAEARVPEDVDAAWHRVNHPEPFWLYGPLQGSPHGCTAAIDGPPEGAFAAWRSTLLDAGWRVVRDDTEVAITRDGVRLTLYVQEERAYLRADPSGLGGCPGTMVAEDGVVSAC